MTRLERFEALIELARDRERKAARALGDARRQFEQEQHQLAALQEHFAEYSARLTGEGGQGGALAATTLREYQHFLGQLDRGIHAQINQVEQQRKGCDHSQASWLRSRIRLQALDKATARLRDRQRAQNERREQKEIDDLVGRWGR